MLAPPTCIRLRPKTHPPPPGTVHVLSYFSFRCIKEIQQAFRSALSGVMIFYSCQRTKIFCTFTYTTTTCRHHCHHRPCCSYLPTYNGKNEEKSIKMEIKDDAPVVMTVGPIAEEWKRFDLCYSTLFPDARAAQISHLPTASERYCDPVITSLNIEHKGAKNAPIESYDTTHPSGIRLLKVLQASSCSRYKDFQFYFSWIVQACM